MKRKGRRGHFRGAYCLCSCCLQAFHLCHLQRKLELLWQECCVLIRKSSSMEHGHENLAKWGYVCYFQNSGIDQCCHISSSALVRLRRFARFLAHLLFETFMNFVSGRPEFQYPNSSIVPFLFFFVFFFATPKHALKLFRGTLNYDDNTTFVL